MKREFQSKKNCAIQVANGIEEESLLKDDKSKALCFLWDKESYDLRENSSHVIMLSSEAEEFPAPRTGTRLNIGFFF